MGIKRVNVLFNSCDMRLEYVHASVLGQCRPAQLSDDAEPGKRIILRLHFMDNINLIVPYDTSHCQMTDFGS